MRCLLIVSLKDGKQYKTGLPPDVALWLIEALNMSEG